MFRLLSLGFQVDCQENSGIHLDEEQIKASFVQAFNSLIRNKAELIRNCRLVMERYTDCTEIDAQISRLSDESDVVVGLTRKWVADNANTAQDSDEFREYDVRYEELQGRINELEAAKRERQDRVNRFEIFIRALEKHHGELTEFDDSVWLAVIDTVTVMPDGKLGFRFVNGMEV